MKASDADVRATRGRYVLAYRPEGAQPWVTWFVDSRGHCHHGHYFRKEQSAWDDLDKRVKADQTRNAARYPEGCPDNYGRTWPGIPEIERCPECGQPDSCGDCSHGQLSESDVILIGGVL